MTAIMVRQQANMADATCRRMRAPVNASRYGLQHGSEQGLISKDFNLAQIPVVMRSDLVFHLHRQYGNAQTRRILNAEGRFYASSIQRKAKAKPVSPPGITAKEIEKAKAWSTKANLGVEAIKALQNALKVPDSGTYDEATIHAVFDKQREWQKQGKIARGGQATAGFFARLGLIATAPIKTATIGDDELDEIEKLFPNGVTIAMYSFYKDQNNNNKEFQRQADPFSSAHKAIGIKNGKITIGQPALPIKGLGEVIEIVQGIHRTLVAKWEERQAKNDAKTGNQAGAKPEPPAFTKVRNLALFSHGQGYGLSLNESNDFTYGGSLHSTTTRKIYPSNVEAFVKGIADAITKDIQVQLYACLAARDPTAKEDWSKPKQGQHSDEGSFASSLASALGPEATVFGHLSAGHTTENYAARVFGRGAGGAGGLHMFDLLYDEEFIQTELARLFPANTDEERATLHDRLRDQMWEHFKDSISGEHKRGQLVKGAGAKKIWTGDKRYKGISAPIGREMFVNPEAVRLVLHQDWTANWIPSRLDKVKPKPTKKSKPKKKPI